MSRPASPRAGALSSAQCVALGRRLDKLDAWRGACGLCGGPDARHRVWDSLRTPDTAEAVARWFVVPIALVRLVRKYPNRTLSAASKRARDDGRVRW